MAREGGGEGGGFALDLGEGEGFGGEGVDVGAWGCGGVAVQRGGGGVLEEPFPGCEVGGDCVSGKGDEFLFSFLVCVCARVGNVLGTMRK